MFYHNPGKNLRFLGLLDQSCSSAAFRPVDEAAGGGFFAMAPHTRVRDLAFYMARHSPPPAVFAELISRVIAPKGRAGIIIPTGIATEDTTKHLFGDSVRNDRLVALNR